MLSEVLQSGIDTVGADSGALLHLESGICLETLGESLVQKTEANVWSTARIALTMLRGEDGEDTGEPINEIVTTSADRYDIFLPLHTSSSPLLLCLRFDTSRVALAMARHRLSGVERWISLSEADRERLSTLSHPIVESVPAEGPEYRRMNPESIRWLEDMKALIRNWARPSAHG